MALARPVDSDALRRAGEWARPVALAGEQLLPVLAPLQPLFPHGGLRRGSTVTLGAAPGATSLALALGAAASVAGSWVAGIGLPSLGLLAAAELGVDLEHLVVVARPPPEAWATVVAAMLDAVDLVWTGLPRRVTPNDARRLAARARERGSVLVPLAHGGQGPGGPGGGGWPHGGDVGLRMASSAWAGAAGDGAGRLAARRVEVVAEGRGAAARERRVSLWLPGPCGRPAPVSTPTPVRTPAGARRAYAGDSTDGT